MYIWNLYDKLASAVANTSTAFHRRRCRWPFALNPAGFDLSSSSSLPSLPSWSAVSAEDDNSAKYANSPPPYTHNSTNSYHKSTRTIVVSAKNPYRDIPSSSSSSSSSYTHTTTTHKMIPALTPTIPPRATSTFIPPLLLGHVQHLHSINSSHTKSPPICRRNNVREDEHSLIPQQEQQHMKIRNLSCNPFHHHQSHSNMMIPIVHTDTHWKDMDFLFPFTVAINDTIAAGAVDDDTVGDKRKVTIPKVEDEEEEEEDFNKSRCKLISLNENSSSYLNTQSSSLSSPHYHHGWLLSQQYHQNHHQRQRHYSTQSMRKNDTHKKDKSNLIVVLDMDECLIHSQFLTHLKNQNKKIHNNNSSNSTVVDKYRQDEFRPTPNTTTTTTLIPNDKTSTLTSSSSSSSSSFQLYIPSLQEYILVHKRQHLDTFLSLVTTRYPTFIFTAAVEEYAKPLLDILDPTNTMFIDRFYRNSCMYEKEKNIYIKNLYPLFPTIKEKILIRRSVEEEEKEKSEVKEEEEREQQQQQQVYWETKNKVLLPLSSSSSSSSSSINSLDRFKYKQQKLEEETTSNNNFNNNNDTINQNWMEAMERRIVLVDNNPMSFLANPSNGILVSNFYGHQNHLNKKVEQEVEVVVEEEEEEEDLTLKGVWELLLELENSHDVRPILNAKFGLKDALKDVF